MNKQFSIGQKKAIALAIHLNDELFFVDGVAYHGNEKTERRAFRDYLREKEGSLVNDTEDNFREYCETECTPLEDYGWETSDHLVLTNTQANQRCEDYIKDSLRAFNPSFLSNITGIDEDVFRAIQANNRCESNNYALLRLVGDDIDKLIDEAISTDGRGHFLATYDGHEHEIDIFGATGINEHFYIYRIN